jgi:translation initiation factor 2B subunit (eIF-2B alpha/beta/delta family)
MESLATRLSEIEALKKERERAEEDWNLKLHDLQVHTRTLTTHTCSRFVKTFVDFASFI